MARIGLVYNLIKPEMVKEGPLDRIAEYDSEGTITAIRSALQSAGHQVLLLEADREIAEKLKAARPEMVFNVAEGLRGESRESHIPAICEMLGIPYTGSGPLTTGLCLDKVRTKEVLAYYRVATPAYQLFHSDSAPLNPCLQFPLIAKLSHEGSSMGLSAKSVVDDEPALRVQVDYLLRTFQEPVLVEEFIAGREFTVAVLGDRAPRVLPIIEVVFEDRRGIETFFPDDDVLPFIEKFRPHNETTPDLPPEPDERSICPAQVDETLKQRIEETTLAVFRAMGCRDWCRMEMRLGGDGQLYVLDVNPIAGIDPTYWFPRAARAAGISYDELVNEILDHALARQKSPDGHQPISQGEENFDTTLEIIQD